MIEEVFPDIFKIRVPLPNNPLGHLNAYFITRSGKMLLIDTGLNFPEAFEALRHGLFEAGVQPQMLTDVLFTHFHIDHIGMIPLLKRVSNKISGYIMKRKKFPNP